MKQEGTIIDNSGHTYPSRYGPGTHWAIDEAWEILDRLPVGMLPNDWRFFLGGMIAGALLKAKRESTAAAAEPHSSAAPK